jgi:hypothetical protein
MNTIEQRAERAEAQLRFWERLDGVTYQFGIIGPHALHSQHKTLANAVRRFRDDYDGTTTARVRKIVILRHGGSYNPGTEAFWWEGARVDGSIKDAIDYVGG